MVVKIFFRTINFKQEIFAISKWQTKIYSSNIRVQAEHHYVNS